MATLPVSAINARLVDYIRHPAVCSTDLRWETVLQDLLDGWIGLEISGDRQQARIITRAGPDEPLEW